MEYVELRIENTIPWIASSRLFDICLASAYGFGCPHHSMDSAESLTGLPGKLPSVSAWAVRSPSEALVAA